MQILFRNICIHLYRHVKTIKKGHVFEREQENVNFGLQLCNYVIIGGNCVIMF